VVSLSDGAVFGILVVKSLLENMPITVLVGTGKIQITSGKTISSFQSSTVRSWHIIKELGNRIQVFLEKDQRCLSENILNQAAD